MELINEIRSLFKDNRLKVLLLFVIIIGFGVLQSCGGAGGDLPGNDGELNPPAPPIQIPQTFALPDQAFDFDLEKVAPASAVSSLAVGSGGEFSFEVGVGFEFLDAPNDLINATLEQFSFVDIPVGTDVTEFEITFFDETVGRDRTLFFDFSDYSLEGSLETVGCTGCTCPEGCDMAECAEELPFDELLPVCYRAYELDPDSGILGRAINGVLRVLPQKDDLTTEDDESNIGKGSFRRGVVKDEGTANEETLYMGGEYDFFDPVDPARRFANVFFFNESIGQEYTIILNFSAKQVGLDGIENDPEKIKTTLKVSSDAEFVEEGDLIKTPLDYLGIFRDDADYWFGSLIGIVDRTGDVNVVDQCVDLRDGNGAELLNCSDLEIDDTDEDFLGLPDESFINGDFLNDVPETR